MSGTEFRDEQIGSLIKAIPIDQPNPSFWASLREAAAQLDQEATTKPKVLRSRGRVRVAALLIGVALVSIGAGTALGAHIARNDRAPTAPTPVSASGQASAGLIAFQFDKDWNTVASSVKIGDQRQHNAWAANVPVASEDSVSGWPMETLKSLPANGIVIWAALNSAVDQPELYPPRELPLSLEDGVFHSGGYETQPAPNVSEDGPIYAKLDEGYVTVQVWFGTNSPSQAMLDQAQSELDRLTVSE